MMPSRGEQSYFSMEHEKLREESWNKAEPAIRAMLERGAQAYLVTLTDHERVFATKDPVCACIDERVCGDKFALAGSGILLSHDEAVSIIRDYQIRSISSHEHCGAAGLAFKTLALEQQTEFGTADTYAQEWTKALAQELGLMYNGHVPVIEGDQHIARVIYYDATGSFNPSALKADGLPPGFLVSRYREKPEVTLPTIGVATDIATGDHGFGKMFTPESPLVIIPVGTENVLPVLRQEIESATRDKFYKASLTIDIGIVAPREALAMAA